MGEVVSGANLFGSQPIVVPGGQRPLGNEPAPAFRPLVSGEFRENADGSRSTELSTSLGLRSGQEILIPSLWMGPNGIIDLKGQQALDTALEF